MYINQAELENTSNDSQNTELDRQDGDSNNIEVSIQVLYMA